MLVVEVFSSTETFYDCVDKLFFLMEKENICITVYETKEQSLNIGQISRDLSENVFV